MGEGKGDAKDAQVRKGEPVLDNGDRWRHDADLAIARAEEKVARQKAHLEGAREALAEAKAARKELN
jgi:hypothetical protein